MQEDKVQGPEVHGSSQDFEKSFHDPEVTQSLALFIHFSSCFDKCNVKFICTRDVQILFDYLYILLLVDDAWNTCLFYICKRCEFVFICMHKLASLCG